MADWRSIEHVRAIDDAAGPLSLITSACSQSLEGEVCISANEVTSVLILPRLLRALRQHAPGIRIELVTSNAVTDLKCRGADIALRGFRPTQPELLARKLADVEAYLYAAPCYLAELGTPDPGCPDDLNHADFIGFDETDALRTMLNARGFALTPRNFPITAQSNLVQWELVKLGAAIGLMPARIADAEPAVRRVLQDDGPLPGELWLAAHRELQTSYEIRTVFDFLVAQVVSDRAD